jgi:hypothetical protein
MARGPVNLCDEKGEIVDGDEVMAIAALDFLRRDCLAKGHSSPR